MEKSGSWYSYKGERIGQGRENARQFLRDNHDIRQTIDAELRKTLGLVKKDVEPVAVVPPAIVDPPPKPVATGVRTRA